MNTKTYRLGDETFIKLPSDKIVLPDSGVFDALEERAWELFKAYADTMGLTLPTNIDFSITKEIEETILGLFTAAGIEIKYKNDTF